MMLFKKLTLLTIVILFSSSLAFAQSDEFTNKFGATVQAWASYGQIHGADTNSLGVGLRRVRLKSYSTFGTKMKGFVQLELTTFKLLDARIEYLLSDAFTLRAGRFIGAGVRAGGLTGHSVIDITERAFSAQRWGAKTIGADYRDYGMDVVGKFGDLKATATLHHGDGSKNITNRMSGPGVKNSSLAFSGMLNFMPKSVKGLEAGAYYGIGNKQFNDYKAYNAYVYYEPGPFRAKAELIGWTNTVSDVDVKELGYYVFAGYKVLDNLELVGRFENFDANTDVDDNELTFITLGATYSLFPSKWHAGKITAAYVIKSESGTELDNNSLQIVMQLLF